MRTRLLELAVLLPFALLTGCAVLDDVGSSEDDLRKHPHATETAAHLTIVLPDGACWKGEKCATPVLERQILIDNDDWAGIGARNDLAPGTHVIRVDDQLTTVYLKPGENRTFGLAVAKRDCSTQTIPTTDFGGSRANSCPSQITLVQPAQPPIAFFASRDCSGPYAGAVGPDSPNTTCSGLSASERVLSARTGDRCYELPNDPTGAEGLTTRFACWQVTSGQASYLHWDSSINRGWSAQLQDVYAAYLPGEYAYPDASTFTLGEKTISAQALNPNVDTTMFSTKITFADTRELPDADTAAIRSTCASDRSYLVPAHVTATQTLKAFKTSACTYTFHAAGVAKTLDQATTNTITLHRLDMDNPQVTQRNGTTVTVKGTYELWQAGERVAGPFPTNTGIDVLAGTYQLITKFSDADGPQTQTENVTF